MHTHYQKIKMNLDYYYSGKINSYEAYRYCNNELNEIDEILKLNTLNIEEFNEKNHYENLEEIWREVMKKVNNELRIPDRIARKKEIIDFVETLLQKKVHVFPVNMFRFNMPKYERSRVAWHQDSQTWPGIYDTYPILKNSEIVTFWTGLTKTDDKNGLAFALDLPLKNFQHEFSEGQGYFNANLEGIEIKSEETIYGDPFTSVIFGQNRLHRTAFGSLLPRISIDLRFYREK